MTFPFPILILHVVDITLGHEMLAFMVDFCSYNQIKLSIGHKKKTSCIATSRRYYYMAMLFGLKNAKFIYQRMMATIFHDIIHACMKLYMDDLLVKSKTKKSHVEVLWKVPYVMIKRAQKWMNPKKMCDWCLF